MIPLLTIALTVVAGFLLALVSEGFGYAVSRVVEPLFDSIEYRLALRAQRSSYQLSAISSQPEKRASALRHSPLVSTS